jgi:hypothetical protein
MTTWGNEAGFKHFLPVILAELTPANRYYPTTVHDGACDLQCVANKLAYAHWQNWPVEEQQAVLDGLRAWWLRCLSLLRQEFAGFLTGHSAEGWDNSAGPAYRELVRSGLLSAAWLQQAWYEALQPAPNQSSASYVQSPAFLMLADWLYCFYYLGEAMPPAAYWDPSVRQHLEEGFFYYNDLAPSLAQRLSNLLYYVEHSIPQPDSSPE